MFLRIAAGIGDGMGIAGTLGINTGGNRGGGCVVGSGIGGSIGTIGSKRLVLEVVTMMLAVLVKCG